MCDWILKCVFWGENGQSRARCPYKNNCCILLDTLVSGSPIIQNGKLIGAVTHVFVDDATKGYGIFAENMLKNAQNLAEQELKEAS